MFLLSWGRSQKFSSTSEKRAQREKEKRGVSKRLIELSVKHFMNLTRILLEH